MKIIDIAATIIRMPGLVAELGDGSQDNLLIEITTDSGILGLGEVDTQPEIGAAVVSAPSSHRASQSVRDLLLGQDPLDPGLWDRLYEGTCYYGRRGVTMHVLSGIDVALWDIRGKAQGLPVSQLLGEVKRTHIAPYASMLMPDTPGEVRAMVRQALDAGFIAMKFGWGVLGQDPDYDGKLAAAARDEAGPGPEIFIDAGLGYGYDVAAALKAAERFASAGIGWLEDPFYPDAFEAYRHLATHADLPIAAGEQETTRWGFRELIERGGLHVAQPDVTRCGGLTEALRISALCADAGVACVPHAWKSGIIKSATLHLNSVLPDHRLRYSEASISPTGINRDMTNEQFTPDAEGQFQVPEEPGLGVTLNNEFVEAHRVSTTAAFPSPA